MTAASRRTTTVTAHWRRGVPPRRASGAVPSPAQDPSVARATRPGVGISTRLHIPVTLRGGPGRPTGLSVWESRVHLTCSVKDIVCGDSPARRASMRGMGLLRKRGQEERSKAAAEGGNGIPAPRPVETGSSTDVVKSGDREEDFLTPAASPMLETEAADDGADPTAQGTEALLSAGSSVARAEDSTDGSGLPTHSWASIPADNFPLRVGPNYGRNRRKEPSGPSLYELIGMDYFKSERRLGRLAERLGFPEVAVPSGHPSVPSLFIINVQLPAEMPSLLKGDMDGPTRHVLFYLGITEETARQLESPEAADPAVRLLIDYCTHAETNENMRSRFKAMAFLNDIGSLDLPGFITSYNGKPILITKSGSITRGGAGGGAPSYLEMDINVRCWSFLAKKGLHFLRPRFQELGVHVAFTVEGRADSELPERVLGCAAVHKLLEGSAVHLPPAAEAAAAAGGAAGKRA